MRMPFRSVALLSLAMFVAMWFASLAQTPGAMETFAEEIARFESNFVPAPQEHVEVETKDDRQQDYEAFWGGVVWCSDDPANGGTADSCHVQTGPGFLW
jgi:hypothetical protein